MAQVKERGEGGKESFLPSPPLPLPLFGILRYSNVKKQRIHCFRGNTCYRTESTTRVRARVSRVHPVFKQLSGGYICLLHR